MSRIGSPHTGGQPNAVRGWTDDALAAFVVPERTDTAGSGWIGTPHDVLDGRQPDHKQWNLGMVFRLVIHNAVLTNPAFIELRASNTHNGSNLTNSVLLWRWTRATSVIVLPQINEIYAESTRYIESEVSLRYVQTQYVLTGGGDSLTWHLEKGKP